MTKGAAEPFNTKDGKEEEETMMNETMMNETITDEEEETMMNETMMNETITDEDAIAAFDTIKDYCTHQPFDACAKGTCVFHYFCLVPTQTYPYDWELRPDPCDWELRPDDPEEDKPEDLTLTLAKLSWITARLEEVAKEVVKQIHE